MTTTASHHLGHAERRRLHAALVVLVLTVVLVVGFVLVARHQGTAASPFEKRIDAINDCDVLATEWGDHEAAFRLTGNPDAQRRADIVHNHEMKIGC